MPKTTLWKRRVDEWRASGLTSTKFCAGRDFTAGGLRHWAHRLRKLAERRAGPGAEAIRLAKVMRAPAESPVPVPVIAPLPMTKAAERPLELVVAGGRIAVASGFCAARLRAVLDVLEERAQKGGRSA